MIMIGLVIMSKMVKTAKQLFHLVIARDGNVDVAKRRVGVAQSDDGDVDVRSFDDGLVIGPGIHDDQKTGLAESGLDLIGESTGSEATSDRSGLGVRGELESCALALRTRRDDEDIGRILNCYNGPGSQEQLLVGPAQVDDVDTWKRWATISVSQKGEFEKQASPSERRL